MILLIIIINIDFLKSNLEINWLKVFFEIFIQRVKKDRYKSYKYVWLLWVNMHQLKFSMYYCKIVSNKNQFVDIVLIIWHT